MALKAKRPRPNEDLSHLIGDEEEKRLNVRMPKGEYRYYQRIAFDRETTVSDLVRHALREYVKKLERE